MVHSKIAGESYGGGGRVVFRLEEEKQKEKKSVAVTADDVTVRGL